MKKLMMTVAIVCATVAVNAATVDWKQEESRIFNGTGGSGKVAEGTTVYLISSLSYDAGDVVSGFQAGTLSAGTIKGYGALTTTINDSYQFSSLGNSSSAFTTGTSESAYYVIFNGDNMFVSEELDAQYNSVQNIYTFAFGDVKDASKALPASAGGYKGAGWYTAAAVPEPTSGLLLLLGMAGLALRRRRA